MTLSSELLMPDSVDFWLQSQQFYPLELSSENQANALILAARQGRADVVAYLLGQGADILQLDSYGNNALWAACYADASACVSLLLQAGIDINFQNSTGATALMYAASSGKTQIVSQLLQAGADASLKSQDDFSALDLAANRECLRLLRQK